MLPYAIFRVYEKKYHTIAQLKGYARHMQRLQETFNANMKVKNDILIGSANIVTDAREYIKGIKLRSNAVLARDLLCTASPEFMAAATPEIKKEWIKANVEFLKNEFGGNIIFSIAHNDEKSLHISSLLIPKFDSKKGPILANRRYFNGKTALSEYQDRYSEAMEKFGLRRGIKWSKSSHTDIKLFYGIINKKLDDKNIDSICAKAKNSELLAYKVKQLQKTLHSYSGYNQKNEQEKSEMKQQNVVLYEQVKEIKEHKGLLIDVIRALSEHYQIPQVKISSLINSMTSKAKEQDQGQALQLTKKEKNNE